MRLRSAILIALLWVSAVSAEVVPVRYREGVVHGFLTLSTLDGKPLAEGALIQTAHGDLVESRLVYKFYDGSIDDEKTEFHQGKVFSLVRYHRIQKGPFFPHREELELDGKTGEVTVRTTESDGKEKVTEEKLELPADLANGLIVVALKNMAPETTTTELSLVAGGKPRVIKLEIVRGEKVPIYIGSEKHESTRFTIKVKIPGVAGVVATVLGKKPPDSSMWILYDETPAFVRSEWPLFDECPLLRTETASPKWSAPK